MIPLFAAAEMAAADAAAVRSGVPERVLVETAGRSAAAVIDRLFPEGRVVALVGSGNNGADALVAARTLRAWGREVCVVLAPGATVRDALFHGHAVPHTGWTGAADLAGAGVIVDGLLGTGARGAPRPAYAEMIQQVNWTGLPVVALDGPSGVDLTTGAADGPAVRASATIVFGALKRGLLRFPGRRLAGRILVVECGFPPWRDVPAAIVSGGWLREHLPAVPPDAHKGTLGTVTVVAGHAGMAGAAVLVAMGALRAGAGKVRIVTSAANRQIVQTAVPEALFVDRHGSAVEEVLRDADAIVAGPGMGTEQAAAVLLRLILRSGSAPLLLDADALTLLSEEPDLCAAAAERRPLLLTPHPGEMARLMSTTVEAVLADPFACAARAAERFRCAVLLKGHPSLVAAEGETTLANPFGHSGVATGGMGDTLAGIAGALLAIGTAPQTAGALALALAGQAALAADRGRSLLPRDVAETLPGVLTTGFSHRSADLPHLLLDLPPTA